MSKPPKIAETAEGGVWYDAGNQKYKGNTADLIPKPTRNKIAATSTSPRFSSFGTKTDKSAIFNEPAKP
mgnify:CR=1 FL=1